jgi:hypothetical protein
MVKIVKTCTHYHKAHIQPLLWVGMFVGRLRYLHLGKERSPLLLYINLGDRHTLQGVGNRFFAVK